MDNKNGFNIRIIFWCVLIVSIILILLAEEFHTTMGDRAIDSFEFNAGFWGLLISGIGLLVTKKK